MYDFYYFNGDSYSAEEQNKKSWVQDFIKLSEIPQEKCFNHAIHGSSNHKIIRNSIESLSDLKKQYKSIFCIIGFSFVHRDELWDDKRKKLETLDAFLDRENIPEELKFKYHLQNINHQMVHFYTNLFMFVNLLEKWNIDYFIFSAANNSDFGTLNWDYLKSLGVYDKITSNPKIYNLHEFYIQDWALKNNINVKEKTFHLCDDNGYRLFAEEIKTKIENLNYKVDQDNQNC